MLRRIERGGGKKEEETVHVLRKMNGKNNDKRKKIMNDSVSCRY